MSDDPSTSDDEKKPTEHYTSRRDTLKAAGAFGLLGLNVVPTLSDKTIEIPIVERDGEALDTFEVPQRWHEQVENTRRVLDRLHDEYNRNPWYDYIAQAADEQDINGLNKHKIRVYVSDTSAARNVIPTSVEGIPISVEESREKHLDDHISSDNQCDENTNSFSCVPGGSYLRDNASGLHDCWSATCIAHNSGSTYLLTSAHPYGNCGDNIGGESTYSGKNSPTLIGDVATYDHDYDIALVDQTGLVNGIDNSIVNESEPAIGALTESACDTLISNYDSIYHMGISTGKTYGWLDEKIVTTGVHCQNNSVEYLKPATDAGGGDSGGPHYWINTEYDWIGILGPHQYHTEVNGIHRRSFCPAGYAIEDALGWTIGSTNPTC